jgi:hypothetical protein
MAFVGKTNYQKYLNYRTPTKTDIGYDLTAMLAVDTEFGKPMGLIQAHLKTADGFETTSDTPLAAAASHLEQVATLTEDAKNMNLGATPVTIIDREAGAVYYMREVLKTFLIHYLYFKNFFVEFIIIFLGIFVLILW